MDPARVHILGASGCGTTTLGRVLANEWSVPHADADDYFWLPTDPPFTTKRDAGARVALMHEIFLARPAWVLSGSLTSWGDELIQMFDAAVFLSLDRAVRLERLRERERRRYGTRIEPGGDREAAVGEFLDWASGYDDPAFAGRSRAGHERWLRDLPCPALRLDADQPVSTLVSTIASWKPDERFG